MRKMTKAFGREFRGYPDSKCHTLSLSVATGSRTRGNRRPQVQAGRCWRADRTHRRRRAAAVSGDNKGTGARPLRSRNTRHGKRRAGLDVDLRLWIILDEYNTDVIERSFYLEPEPPIGRFSKAFFLPIVREFIARRKSLTGVDRARYRVRRDQAFNPSLIAFAIMRVGFFRAVIEIVAPDLPIQAVTGDQRTQGLRRLMKASVYCPRSLSDTGFPPGQDREVFSRAARACPVPRLEQSPQDHTRWSCVGLPG